MACLSETHLKLTIDTDDFTDNDLYIIKNLERIFVIKNTVKVQGHYMVTKHQNFITHIEDSKRIIIQIGRSNAAFDKVRLETDTSLALILNEWMQFEGLK